MEGGSLKTEGGGLSAHVLRLFVAISPPEEVKGQIEKAQRELRGVMPGNIVRWTKRGQFHLTLKFLGNVAEARVDELGEALRAACHGTGPLRLRADCLGFFPGARAPRVLWVGVHDEREALPGLQRAIEDRTQCFTATRGTAAVPAENSPAGRRRSQEKAFAGHITLGRIPQIRRSEAEILSKAVSSFANPFFGEWTANHVELIRSELLPGGSRYTTLAEIPLLNNS